MSDSDQNPASQPTVYYVPNAQGLYPHVIVPANNELGNSTFSYVPTDDKPDTPPSDYQTIDLSAIQAISAIEALAASAAVAQSTAEALAASTAQTRTSVNADPMVLSARDEYATAVTATANSAEAAGEARNKAEVFLAAVRTAYPSSGTAPANARSAMDAAAAAFSSAQSSAAAAAAQAAAAVAAAEAAAAAARKAEMDRRRREREAARGGHR